MTALCDDTSYIFPTKVCTLPWLHVLDFDAILQQDGEIVSNKPFHHPALISILRDVYFAGTRGLYAERYSARFGSSITEGPRKYECELPAPMVALAATAMSEYFAPLSKAYSQSYLIEGSLLA